MARINLPEQKVAPRAAPSAFNTQKAPDLGPELQRGYAKLAAGVQSAAHDLGEGYNEHKRQADLVQVNDGLNELQRGGTNEFYGNQNPSPQEAADAAFDERDPRQGYLAKKGAAASEAGVETYDRLEKKRRELLEGLENDAQKKQFKQQSDRLMGQWYGQIEQHTFREKEQAKVDSLKNSIDEAKRAASMNPADDNAAMHSIGRIVGLQDQFATSTQDALVEATKVQGDVTTARLDALLVQPGGFADAERVLETNKAALGTKYDEYRKRVDTAKLGGIAEVAAAQAAAGATDPKTGRINDGKALELLEKQDLSPEARKRASERLDHRLLVNERVWKEQVAGQYDGAFSTYLRTQTLEAVPPATREWLIDNAPAKWDELVQKQARDRDRARRILRGEHNEGETASERAALVELQSDIVRNPDKYAEMSPQAFNAEWGARLSPSGFRLGGTAFANASKGDRLSDSQFSGYVNELVRTTPSLVTSDTASKQEKAHKAHLADGFRADFGEARRAFKEKNKRNPSAAEVQDPDFQKSIWQNTLRRSGIKLENPTVLPELDFSGGPAAGPTGTGVFKTDSKGVRWERLSDGSARRAP